METNEIKNLDYLKKLSAQYCTTLNPSTDKKEFYTAQIELIDYNELASIITNLIKLCIVTLDQDLHGISNSIKNSSINVSLILETVLRMFPIDEFEMLSEISKMVGAGSKKG
ncbi:hypothetical protein [Flavobacterium chilense]|uniref:Uncharacterized protein n=1 Tax=Flavobacterium chilense TaxID=946677 RepID=A0A1M7D7C2_9FLAO|nr:hypothetical protein [Flavobacterium chilense]SHL75273.1 hypothetical protein SAMN05444484_102456 [Flavobacterium chilense]